MDYLQIANMHLDNYNPRRFDAQNNNRVIEGIEIKIDLQFGLTERLKKRSWGVSSPTMIKRQTFYPECKEYFERDDVTELFRMMF